MSPHLPQTVSSQQNLICAYGILHWHQTVHLKFTVTCTKTDLKQILSERNTDRTSPPLDHNGIKPEAKEQKENWEIPKNLEIKQLQTTQVKQKTLLRIF